MKFKPNIPISLYIHTPWCIKKCPYCDFNSHATQDALPEEAYGKALIQDLEHDLADVQNRTLSTIFIGGGTPSLLSPVFYKKLLQEIGVRIALAPNIEITLEANPGTVEQSRFDGYREAGINRLSLGVQSFSDEKLKALGRIHDSASAKKAIATVKQAGFDNFNIDIMYGLPEQTLEQALDDIKQAMQHRPPHLSWYQLTLEPNTFFYSHPPKLPDDDHLWEIQNRGLEIISQTGLHQYEVSAYSKAGLKCRHNLNYWQFGDYLGIGAGAHSKITDVNHMNIKRTNKYKNPKNYLDEKKPFIQQTRQLNQKDILFEFMLNALRLNQPITQQLFESQTGLAFDTIKNKLEKVDYAELINLQNQTLETTPMGRRYLNDLMSLFLD